MVPVSRLKRSVTPNTHRNAKWEKSLTSNAGDRGASGAANAVAIGGEAPEALGVVDRGVGQSAGVLGAVDVAEVIGARGVVLQGHSEQRRVQLRLDGVKEGGLLSGPDGIDGAESQTQQAVVGGILNEFRADSRGGLDGLARGSDATNVDSIGIHITAGRASVAIRDRPGSTGNLAGAAAGSVETVVTLLRGRELGRKHPTVDR